MHSMNLNAAYTKKEQTSELNPVITNTVSVNTYAPGTSKALLPPKHVLARAADAPTPPLGRPDEPVVEVSTSVSSTDVKSTDVPVADLSNTDKAAFEHKLLSVCISVLSAQDKTLLNNIIDQTGDIILAAPDLTQLIAIATGASEESIRFIPDDRVRAGCFSKLPVWTRINKIIVNESDFEICYNKTYVMFATYRISLEKVIL